MLFRLPKIAPSLARSRTSGRSTRLGYASLEDRRLLAVNVYFDAATGVVSIYGDSADDSVYVVEDSVTETQIQFNGSQTVNYATNEVNEIKFWAGDGADFFQNDTAIISFFAGQNGNDTFQGGSNADRMYGGNGNDTIFGGDGNDFLEGGEGNDEIHGEGGDDTLYGWLDDDVIYGGAGDDLINAAWGDDTVYGGSGSDYIMGSAGNDNLSGGDGDDFLYGHAGNDSVYGNDGNDIVRGNNGDDLQYGGAGNDYMMTDVGNDIAYGEGGADTLLGSEGNDILYGGDGDDNLFGMHEDDEIHGGAGDDFILGGAGNDVAYGDEGADRIFGMDGVDFLFGGTGVDNLFGGADDDALFGGGLSSADQLMGNEGQDRYLLQNGDVAADRNPEDAVLNFVNADDNWTDREIEVMGEAFTLLHDVTGNNVLLKDTFTTDDLTFHKYASLNGAAGVNWEYTSWTSYGGQVTYTYSREIHIADWNENSQWYNDQYRSVAIHEIGHNWESEVELSAVDPALSNAFDQFMTLSGWTDVNPNSSNYSLSNDGQWWYDNSAVFAGNYGQTNPYEDFSTMWQVYFDNLDTPENIDPALTSKIAALDALFSAAATV